MASVLHVLNSEGTEAVGWKKHEGMGVPGILDLGKLETGTGDLHGLSEHYTAAFNGKEVYTGRVIRLCTVRIMRVLLESKYLLGDERKQGSRAHLPNACNTNKQAPHEYTSASSPLKAQWL